MNKLKNQKRVNFKPLEEFILLQIENKVKDIEELALKLEDVYTIIGVDKDATKKEISEKH